jgi:hypothetical protein
VKVLLADDDAERAGAVARVLAADAGLTVLRLTCHASLAEAVALFRRHQQARDDLKEADARPRERAVIDKAKARRIVEVASALIKELEGDAG